MRTSDWSSDVCSSDLKCADFFRRDGTRRAAGDLGTMKAIERALASQPFVPEPIEERPHRRQFPRGRCIRKPSNTPLPKERANILKRHTLNAVPRYRPSIMSFQKIDAPVGGREVGAVGMDRSAQVEPKPLALPPRTR